MKVSPVKWSRNSTAGVVGAWLRQVRPAHSVNRQEPAHSNPFMKTPVRYLVLASLAVGLTLPVSL